MAFIQLIKNTTISASDVNSNFYHVAQGNLLPMGSINLTNTNSVYDLGSISYKYSELHVNNIHVPCIMDFNTYTVNMSIWVSSTSFGYQKIYFNTTLAATASSINITGLNSDYDSFMELDVMLIMQASNNAYLYINGNSTTIYGTRITYAQNTVYTGTSNFSISGWPLGYTDKYIKGNFVLCLTTNYKKFILGDSLTYNSSTTIIDNRNISGVMSLNGTVTSIKIVPGGASYFSPGTHVTLIGKN
jgi:hypothetical protein